jgi:hypothetical protein
MARTKSPSLETPLVISCVRRCYNDRMSQQPSSPRKRRYFGVPLTAIIGIVIGSFVRIAAVPGDPTGKFASPIAGGVCGLILALFVLVLVDNDPWRVRGPNDRR